MTVSVSVPGFAVDDVEVGTEAGDKHVCGEEELCDGGGGQGDGQTHAPQQGRGVLPRQGEGHLGPQSSEDLYNLWGENGAMVDK